MPRLGSDRPFVSVVLPVRNEGRAFASTLEAVLGQDYPADRMEVLVVDGMSTDATRDVVRGLSERDSRVRLLDNPGRTVPHAMNRGIGAARGEFLVRVDGHTIVPSDYVTRCVATWQRSGADCVGGRMDAVGATAFGCLVALATSSPFGIGNSHFHYGREPRLTDSVYMGAWPVAVLRSIGGFDEEMVRNQDDELNFRLRKLGGRVLFDPSIASRYTPRGDLKPLWKQYYQYGLWKIRVLQKHPTMLSARHFMPAAFVLIGTAAAAAAVGSAWGRIVFAAGVGVYLLAAAIAAARLPGTLAQRVGLPLVFFVLHAAYGLGFLVGLVRFRGYWFHRGSNRDYAGRHAA